MNARTGPEPVPAAGADATPAIYPGQRETAADLLVLADEYASAAARLLAESRGRKRLARNPAHLCAIHAIELYLNAYLLHRGQPPELVRAMQHGVDRKAELAVSLGLLLTKRAAVHLAGISAAREYLVVRYAPSTPLESLSPSNRHMAIVGELARKVKAAVGVETRPACTRP